MLETPIPDSCAHSLIFLYRKLGVECLGKSIVYFGSVVVLAGQVRATQNYISVFGFVIIKVSKLVKRRKQ